MLVLLKSTIPYTRLLQNTKYFLSTFTLVAFLKNCLYICFVYQIALWFVGLFFKKQKGEKWLPLLSDSDCLEIFG